MIGWWAIAAAQDLAVPEPPPPVPYEITVWGDLAVDKARDTIVREIESHGYTVARRKNGDTVFRGHPRWRGNVTLSDDGTLAFSRPILGFSAPPPQLYTQDPLYQDVTRPDPLSIEPACNSSTWYESRELSEQSAACVGVGPVKATFWLAPSMRKLQTGRDQLLADTRDEVDEYLAIKRRTVFEQSLLDLPDRLDALWATGAPLDPGPPLLTPEARRRAVLEFWATRADTPEGERTSEAVEDWLGAVVESGPTPITPEERAEFSARRPDRQLP